MLCPPGTFSNKTGNPAREDCEPCTAGLSCSDHGLVQPNGVCTAGFFCPAGTAVPWLRCLFGFHCPSGSSEPQLCPAGSYQDEVGRADCKGCPAGAYCSPDDTCLKENYTEPRACPPGHYCLANTSWPTQFPCPNGTFSNWTGLRAEAQCLACLAGMYCDRPGLAQPTGPCSGGYYCTRASNTASPVDGVMGGMCPMAHYCPVGTAQPVRCPAGTYSVGLGLQNASQCEPCPAGFYCGSQGPGLCLP